MYLCIFFTPYKVSKALTNIIFLSTSTVVDYFIVFPTRYLSVKNFYVLAKMGLNPLNILYLLFQTSLFDKRKKGVAAVGTNRYYYSLDIIV